VKISWRVRLYLQSDIPIREVKSSILANPG